MAFLRHSSNKRWTWIIVTLFAGLVAAGVAVFASRTGEDLSAQSLPPSLGAIIFTGAITVNGTVPEHTGFELTARIGEWESQPVIVGERLDQPYKYYHLVVNAPEAFRGQQIEFWIDGQVMSSISNYFAVIYPGGEVCRGCPFTFPILRELDLDFPRLPQPTPTPTIPPTPTEVILQAAFFGGTVRTGTQIAPDNYDVYAVVGTDFKTPPVPVVNGQYFLAIDPQDEKYRDASVRFFIIDKGHPDDPSFELEAISAPGIFVGGEQFDTFNLIFPALTNTPTPTSTFTATATPTPTPMDTPTATPTDTPTPTPTPTVTPEPTGTPTPTPTSTPTFTPEPTRTPTPTSTSTPTPPIIPDTPTPTPLSRPASPEPTAELEPDGDDSGGFCNATPASSGSMEASVPFGLALILATAAWRYGRTRSYNTQHGKQQT